MSKNTQKHIPYLDGWWGLAIIFVLLGHFGPWRFWYFGRFGVVLFFVLSGMFMAKLLFLEKVKISTFFARRASRILPVCWIYLTTMYFFIAKILSPNKIENTESLISSYFFLGTYVPKNESLFDSSFHLGHLWSLNVEEHGYIFLAVGAVLLARFNSKRAIEIFLFTTTLFIISIAIFFINGLPSYGALSYRNHTEVASLGLIFSAALTVYFSGRQNVDKGKWWIPIIAVLASFSVAIPDVFGLSDNVTDFLTLILCPVLAAYSLSKIEDMPNVIKKVLSSRFMRWFGTMSFSIYIWQQPFYEMVKEEKLLKFSMVPVVLVVAILSFYCLENPARKFLNRKFSEYSAKRHKSSTNAADDVAT